MAYEYAISAGPGTLVDYGAVETLDDALDTYYDALFGLWMQGDKAVRVEDAREIMAIMIGYTGDAHDCETGR